MITALSAVRDTSALLAENSVRNKLVAYLKEVKDVCGTLDLPMVSTIGELMGRCTGKHDLAWVNIHVKRERAARNY